jgi:hypothetical protein
MARPRGKTLLGPEGGNASQHWYNFIASKRTIKRLRLWDGGSPQCKPGTSWVIAVSLLDKPVK